MHLRYTRERKRRGCGKGKGTKESRTNDVDNNDRRNAVLSSYEDVVDILARSDVCYERRNNEAA